MGLTEWLNTEAPQWVLAVFLMGLLAFAYFVGVRINRKRGEPDLDADASGFIISTLLGLLALLLGFTFALAVDRFESRRLLVLDEANAIRTSYLQAQTFEEPERALLSSLLVAYADNRLRLGSTRDRADTVRLMAVSYALQQRMWRTAVTAVNRQRDDVSATFMQSMNQLIEIAAARRSAREAHVPTRVFAVLIIYMIVSAAILGYVLGGRQRTAMLTVFLLLTMSYVLIVDIDEAKKGGIRESQQPMEELRMLKHL